MMLNRNLDKLRRSKENIYNFVAERIDQWSNEPLCISTARNGMLTLKLKAENKEVYFHSQYDPQNEAERLLEKYSSELEGAKHVLFYGFGLGYHIDAIVKKYKQISYTIYEPYPAVILHALTSMDYESLHLNKAEDIYLEDHVDYYVNNFVTKITEDVVIIALPVYERLFENQYKVFLEKFRFYLEQQRTAIGVNYHFERLWIINSECNFNKIMRTPSIIRECEGILEDKTAIIVAAGPSLQEDIETLRAIKNEGAAYIFAVGSANKALLAEQLYPHAVCSYDPSLYNHNVFEEIITQEIKDIPLIFGSTIGFQTLEKYPGPMLHMITSQDKISSFYFGGDDLLGEGQYEVVSDAPSIAVVTLELLQKLGCKRIVLVGQNFAFKNNQYYSKGISYSYRGTELTEGEANDTVEVESVYGDMVLSNIHHAASKRQMESYISRMEDVDIINATRGGAKISGTRFMPLEEVRDAYFKPNVVDENWYNVKPTQYDSDHLNEKFEKMKKDHSRLDIQMRDVVRLIKQLETTALMKDIKRVQTLFAKFEKINRDIYGNLYYQYCIQPMVRVQFAIFQKALAEIQKTTDVLKKAKLVVQHYGSYILACQHAVRDNEQFYQVMDITMQGYLDKLENQEKVNS
ncbi:motility associated factor glycosyltransferase family protein [Paenibacillus frigoriresistens]|uniref:motility associated factor glycosyltransferase family protein n=1 Tax=Paenibacillus alginolyticus TaxID=59839 RepID=UPI001566FEA0|nr:6-hydroxymethylpterin diphosphokinase MptE-like protein [Paenibacillus frigoriresistens]NRF93656.1 motility associated factor glycosyltransferase family protein [Paenibacillus frigoriresistens]